MSEHPVATGCFLASIPRPWHPGQIPTPSFQLSAPPPMEERLLKIKVVQTALVCSSQQSWELSILPMLQRWKLRRRQQDQSLQSGSDPVCTAFPFSPTPSSVSHSPFTGRAPHILRGNSHSFSLSSHLVVRSKKHRTGQLPSFLQQTAS